ncbi:integral membrane protein-like protein [Dothidotthia symphoricarpi CBS 119687]|uniref:Integral membrane protein-like protein n=1 Tax=Dothidotthia symphoricarpi CBS 119687 TaxID=1392245 RepID=A0A6A6AKP6_9PLEO|nr:integral membrane protein-like protein [Dothidotthia symphoricarpi CBS 119687]KAF2132136.1 integral membrane protein-like protein [Dothidotthia symphoricarpi CBS 119687]
MGKLGRFACIFTPMVLTLLSLVCLLVVMVGQLGSSGNKAPSTVLGRDLYFFKADTSGFTADPDSIVDKVENATNMEIDNDLLNALQGAASSKDMKDFYQVGLWSYCTGTKDKDGKETIDYCSSSKSTFWFNPIDVWGLNGTSAQKVLGDDLQKGLDAYQKVAGWMVWSFIIAVCLTAAEFVIGFFAIFSRWGSFVVGIISTAQTIFVLGGAITASAIYGALVGVFHSVLEPYNIDASMGKQMMSVLWIGVAFSVGSGLFWLASMCCCSGQSGKSGKKVVVEKTPYTYERVASPAFPHQQQQQHSGFAPSGHGQSGTAYEPFRSQRV